MLPALRTFFLVSTLLLLAPVGGSSAGARADLDTALLPVFSSIPSDADLAAIKKGVEAAIGRNFATALAAEKSVRDATGRKLVHWFLMKSRDFSASPRERESFRKANPDWPGEDIRAAAEEGLLTSGVDPVAVLSFFKTDGPRTGAGKAALAAALLATGDRTRATAIARAGWREDTMSGSVEDAFLAATGGIITAADHKARVDRILYADSRWDAVRGERIGVVRRLLKHLGPLERAKAEARLAVYRCIKGRCLGGAKTLMLKLPAAARDDPGVIYHRVQLMRRSGKERDAWSLLLEAPTDKDVVISPDDWWVERRANIYNALYAGERKVAYQLAANHGELTVNPLKDAEFMAGWIALRFLRDAKTAARHFHALGKAADGPISRAEADYWLGRTYEVLADRSLANEHYARAGSDPTTFYGQLALQTLDKKISTLAIEAAPSPDAAAAAAFTGRDIVKAIVIARKAGLTDTMRVLVSSFRSRVTDEASLVLLAHLAQALGDTQMAVRVGKTGLAKGFRLLEYAYPVGALPKFEPLRKLPEEAIFYAIARQESEFNTLTVSGAGAKGILQVMTVTAKHVCRQYRIKCELNRLISDPAFNARLATAYIADRHDDFTGSYIMAFAGYNAGPGRVKYWVGKIGDPRRAEIDPVDWIEMIHIEETRDYVQKVLSNVQVYRARLGDPKTALRIRQDLARARSKEAAAN